MNAPLQVAYVTASSHSGSTLLALLADQHPQLASVGETAVKPRIRRERRTDAQRCSCGEPIGRCAFWNAVFTDVSAAGVTFDAAHWTNDYRFENVWLDALLTRETSFVSLRRARRWMARRVPALRNRTARIDRTNVAFVRAVLAHTGATVFLDTTKLLTRLTYLLEVPEFRVKVIRLVRDVRGFAASAKRRGESAVDAAVVWRHDQMAIEQVLSDAALAPALLVRYEDLCTKPGDTLRRLWEFCEVEPFEPSVIVRARQHHVIGNSMRMGDAIEVRLDEAWRSSLAADEERAVLDAAGGVNERLGYA